VEQREVRNGVDASVAVAIVARGGSVEISQVRHGIGTRRAVDSLLGRLEIMKDGGAIGVTSDGTRTDPHFAAGFVAVFRVVIVDVDLIVIVHGDEIVSVRRR